MSSWPAHTSYQADLGMPMPAEGLRIEDAAAPALDTVVLPGSLIRTSYGTGPYFVEKVTRRPWRDHTTWSITGWRADADGLTLREEHHRFWINDLVVIWDDGEPRIRVLFANNDDEIYVVGRGHIVARSGQLALFA